MSDRYVFRPASPTDLDAILALLAASYPALRDDPAFAREYYGWKYFDREGRETGFPTALLAQDGEGLAGFVGCLPFRLRRGARVEPAAWVSDWRLAPRARGSGLGRRLLTEAMGRIPVMACVNGSVEAERIYREVGFRVWECGRAWLRTSRPLRFEWPRRRGWRKPVGAFRALATGRAPRVAEAGSLSIGEAVDFEAIRGIALPRKTDGLVRDAAYLSWLGRSPAGRMECRLITSQGRPAGYALLLRGVDNLARRRGRIVDLALAEESTEHLAAAFGLCIREFEASDGVDYIDARAPLDWSQALTRAGFRGRSLERLWIWANQMPLDGSTQWSLSFADKDDAFRGFGRVP